MGGAIKNFKPGDRIATGADVPCGVCEWCRSGLGNNCEINYAIGYQFPGGFSQYILLNELTMKYGPVHPIPKNLSFDEAALAEPLACCINGLEMANLRPGETILIIGAGPAGCLLVELARSMGAGKIILAQRSKKRLELAKKFSADVFISTQEENLSERIKEETGGRGVDVVIVATGTPEAQGEALKVVGHRSRVNFFGGLPKNTPPLSIDTNLLHYKEVFLFGSHGSVPRQHLSALKLLGRGSIKVKPLITHSFPLTRIEEAFRVVEERKGLKVVVHPRED